MGLDSLAVYAGAGARQKLAQEGWQPQLFDTLVGASGGPKFLGIAGLDRFLFGDFLQRSNHPMHLIGSSIGSWRHSALAAPQPMEALARLHERYLNQYFDADDTRSTTLIVGELCQWILDGVHDTDSYAYLCDHPRFCSHVVTARGRGLNSAAHPLPQALGMVLAALSNSVHRQLLQPWFQRVVFSSHGNAGLAFVFEDFSTLHVPLTATNARAAILASGSIPFLMPGERDIGLAPAGHYWDGGIVDYHFDFGNHSVRGQDQGLVLYPHFRTDITPGWFDKFLPWRRANAALLDQVVVLCPSPAYLARLPHGKIPDRGDFRKLDHAARVSYWRQCMDASEALGQEFAELVSGADPVAGVKGFS
jgi:hypothetical protein